MQFIKNNLKHIRLLSTKAIDTQPAFKKGIQRYTPQNMEILNDTMIPGPYLKYFKSKKPKNISGMESAEPARLTHLYTTPARSIHLNEFDSTPTITQERLAERIHRAITLMYSIESMPSKWISLEYLSIRSVKVSRNLRKCQIFYEPMSNSKSERGNTHRALQQYSHLLGSMIRTHAHLKRPLSVKFMSDTHTKELNAIYDQIQQEDE
ncbi:hypothetical protein BDB01DRAFT_836961 [Pilobolus umbonatus]|nr:hypothetical protein BDB01DRAFT_836961 [Pilobolus umbonatus]